MNSRLLSNAVVVAIVLLASPPAFSQTWPAKPVRIIVPAAAGTTQDILTRGLSDRLGKALGQAVVVENRVGADGIIGTEVCARSAADGYTLCGTASNVITFNTVLRKNLPYDVLRDFAPVAQAGFFDSFLVTHPSLPVTTFAQLIDYAKTNPNKVNWGHFGVNSPGYLYMEWFRRSRNLQFYPVPYKTQPQSVLSLVTGESSVAMGSFNNYAQLVKDGKVRALAVTTSRRVDWLPNVPTVEELGIQLSMRNFFGYHYPINVPRELVLRLNGELRKIVELPSFKTSLLDRLFITPGTGTPEEFDRFIREQIKTLTELVAYIELKPE